MKLTEMQLDAVRDEVSILLYNIFPDDAERHEIRDLVLDDVVLDIEETADWSGYEDDEYCLGDIQIALKRVIKRAVKFYYTTD
jgi:hypothetical protein